MSNNNSNSNNPPPKTKAVASTRRNTLKILRLDSAFDWGESSRSLAGLKSSFVNIGIGGRAASPNDAHELPNTTSRYDPSAMSRITNINDLVNNSPPTSDDEHDVEEGHSTSFGALRIKMKKKIMCRQVLVITALVLVIIASSLAILYAVGGNTKVQTSYSISSHEEGQEQQQHLLELAERVITACDENKLNEDMSECQSLCQTRMCCFDESEDGYGCQDDTSKDCAVYAGCEALVMGVVVDGVEEDEA